VSAYRRLLRVEGVWEAEPTHGLLCVDGRFAPIYDEQRERIKQPLIRREGELVAVDWDTAQRAAAAGLQQGRVVGLASGANTNEGLAALKSLVKGLGGEVGRLGATLPHIAGAQEATVPEVANADLVIVAGADPLAQHRVLGYLAKRARDHGARIALVCDGDNTMAEFADVTLASAEAEQLVGLAAEAERPVVLYGAHATQATLDVLARLAGKATFLGLEPSSNGRGMAGLGIAPIAANGAAARVLLLGEAQADALDVPASDGAFTVAIASYRSAAVAAADVVLPAPIWAERSGHVTNLEGRVSALNSAVAMPQDVRDEVDILTDLKARL